MHVRQPYPPQLVIHDDDTTNGNPLNCSLKLPINLFLLQKSTMVSTLLPNSSLLFHLLLLSAPLSCSTSPSLSCTNDELDCLFFFFVLLLCSFCRFRFLNRYRNDCLSLTATPMTLMIVCFLSCDASVCLNYC